MYQLGPQGFIVWEKETHMKNRNKWKYVTRWLDVCPLKMFRVVGLISI